MQALGDSGHLGDAADHPGGHESLVGDEHEVLDNPLITTAHAVQGPGDLDDRSCDTVAAAKDEWESRAQSVSESGVSTVNTA